MEVKRIPPPLFIYSIAPWLGPHLIYNVGQSGSRPSLSAHSWTHIFTFPEEFLNQWETYNWFLSIPTEKAVLHGLFKYWVKERGGLFGLAVKAFAWEAHGSGKAAVQIAQVRAEYPVAGRHFPWKAQNKGLNLHQGEGVETQSPIYRSYCIKRHTASSSTLWGWRWVGGEGKMKRRNCCLLAASFVNLLPLPKWKKKAVPNSVWILKKNLDWQNFFTF